MSTDPNDLWNEGEDEPTGNDSEVKQLRARADQAAKLEKQVKKLSDEAEGLRAFKEEAERATRVSSAEKAFEAAKLPPKLAALFVKDHEGDITEESVKEFGKNYGLVTETPVEEPAKPAEETPGFNPTVAGDQPPPQKITRKEIDDLFRTDPKRAATLLIQMGREDRIEWNNPEGVAQTLRGAEIE